MQNKIHIALAIDNNYAVHCATTMTSILSNTNSDICFHILSNNLSDKHKQKLSTLHFKYEIKFYDVSALDLSSMPLNREHISIATYYRLLLANFVDVDRLIYLDCDTIVLDDISKLWSIKLKNRAFAVTKDECNIFHLRRLHLKKYFNAGVLLINMKEYKKYNLSNYISIIENNKNDILCQDQDILNIVFKDSVRYISLRWNANSLMHHPEIFSHSTITLEESHKAKSNPAIIHYTGPSKPWHFTNCHPRKLEYLRYLCKTNYYKEIAIQCFYAILSYIIKIDITFKEKTLRFFTYPIISIFGNSTKKVLFLNALYQYKGV